VIVAPLARDWRRSSRLRVRPGVLLPAARDGESESEQCDGGSSRPEHEARLP
jgi:hypothetical protein